MMPNFGGEATARPADFPTFAGRALYTTSPYIHETSATSGVQSGNFLKNFRASPEIGSVANAVAWSPKSSSTKRYCRMPRSEQFAAARRSAASSGTVQKTIDEMS